VRGSRIAYLATHPIQYQAPLLRKIADAPDLSLHVFFRSIFSAESHFDSGFARDIHWDVPLLNGYPYSVLKVIGKQNPQNFWRPINWGLAKELRRGKFTAFWVHGYSSWLSLYSLAIAKSLGLRTLLSGDSWLSDPGISSAKRLYKLGLFSYLMRYCDAFMAAGTRTREYYLSLGVPPERIFHFPNSVDNAFFRRRSHLSSKSKLAFKRMLGIPTSRPVVLYAGKLTEGKRVGDLIAAYNLVTRTSDPSDLPSLVIVGDGPDKQRLASLAGTLRRGSVKLVGFGNQSQMPSYYSISDVLVLPSARESWGLVVN